MKVFRLYIASNSNETKVLCLKIRNWLDDRFPEKCRFDVINVLERPDIAVENNVIATPTLIRIEPQPERRVLGNLKNIPVVFQKLGFGNDGEAEQEES